MEYTQKQWNLLLERYPPGTPIIGTVSSILMCGAFVKLDELPDVPALLEVIHFLQVENEPNKRIQFPVDYLSLIHI